MKTSDVKLMRRTTWALFIFIAATLAAPLTQAASATASAIFDGIVDIRTTGTATAFLTGLEFLDSLGTTAGGVPDPLNNGETFDSSLSPFGEGTATNSGAAGATSFADASGLTMSHSHTFADVEIELAGTGDVEIDFAFDLFVDTFDNLTDAFAIAGIEVSNSFGGPESIFLDVMGEPGAGVGDALAGILTLMFPIDIPVGSVFDFLLVHTTADASSSPVPVPGIVWLFGSAAIFLGRVSRRAG